VKLLLVDGTNLVMRYAHAMLRESQADADDEAALPVLRYCESAMRSVVETVGATHAVVALDSEEETWRKKLYPAYKANRGPGGGSGSWSRRFREGPAAVLLARVLLVPAPGWGDDGAGEDQSKDGEEVEGMSIHPNAMLLLSLTPEGLSRKTRAAIMTEAGIENYDDEIKIGGVGYSHFVMEEDYEEGYQIRAKKGDIVLWDLVTYGYGEVISWSALEKQKNALEVWARGACERHACSYEIFITANYW